MTKRCLIMAGGTGGHVFPGLALAHALKAQGWHIDWLGTAERMEAQVVPKYGYPIHFIPVSGLRGKGIGKRIHGVMALIKSLFKARKIIQQLQPDLVVGMGGYASGPGGFAAWTLKLPLLVHEQNAVPGMTNRLLSRFARKVCLGFAQAQSYFGANSHKCAVVGNPVREDIVQLPAKTRVNQPLHLLVVGGSLGAQALNEILPVVINGADSIKVWHQCGKGNQQTVAKLYESDDVTVTEFIDDMPKAYQWADIIVCRAGALTVAEVAAAGLAAVFVPLPHAVDDHQTRNGASLADKQGAILIPQAKLAKELPKVIENWQHQPQQILTMGAVARSLSPQNVTATLVAYCESLVKEAA
jgi:UDP-N-acetylglucosamine--N-acetylmuramyl-(pentapeptide) pyrophosphoryl-undecaprenol N-acetylglucosamine transferase